MAKKKVETKAKSKSEKTREPAAAAKTAEKTVTNEVKAAKPVAAPKGTNAVLRKWNLVLSGVYAVQAAAIALFGNATAVPVEVSYPTLDTLATEANKHEMFATASRQLFDVPIAYLLAAGLLVFALVHLLAATRFRKQFDSVMDRGVNTARWVAYGFGGVWLFDAMYLVTGVHDLGKLKLLGAALLGACVAALAVDLLGPNRPGLSRLLKWMALVSGVLPWVMIIATVCAVHMYDGKLPAYLYGVYASTFILVAGIALATWLRWSRRGRWANTLYSEKMFMLLGLATATVLAWQIFAGTLL